MRLHQISFALGAIVPLDRFLPEYHFHEIHYLSISAPPAAVYSAARNLTIAELPAPIFWMMSLRGLPAWLQGKNRHNEAAGAKPLLEQMMENNFTLLEEVTGREIVFGMIGEFWRLMPATRKLDGPQAFLESDAPGCAKVAANIRVQAKGGKCLISTETRIWASDARTRRKFGMYWAVISKGSGIIRMLWLRAIRRKAERESSRAPLPE